MACTLINPGKGNRGSASDYMRTEFEFILIYTHKASARTKSRGVQQLYVVVVSWISKQDSLLQTCLPRKLFSIECNTINAYA